MKVWVSRSQPGADRQAADLRAAGHEPLVAPVIRIEPLARSAPPGPFDVVIFLSEHAVRFGFPALHEQGWFGAARVLAVGQRTAAVLADSGVAAQQPHRASSEGLLALDTLGRLDGGRVLLVSGAGGRELLAGELAERGARVSRFDCYRRRPAATVSTEVLECDAVIAASGEGLRAVARLWLAAGGPPDVPVLVPSARVAGLAVEVGLSRLHDCAGADSAAWLRGLAELQSTGRA